MKKIIALLLVSSMLVLALTGCGASNDDADSATEEETTKPVWTQKGDFAVGYFKGTYFGVEKGNGNLDIEASMLPSSEGDSSRINIYEDGQEITGDASMDPIECTYTVNGEENECSCGQLNSYFSIEDDEKIFEELKNGNDVEIKIELTYRTPYYDQTKYYFTLESANFADVIDNFKED